jgi:hypothetical protein
MKMSIYYRDEDHELRWSSREQGDVEMSIGTWNQPELSFDFGPGKFQIRGLTLDYIFEELCALPQFRWLIKEKALELMDASRINRHGGRDNLKQHRESKSSQRLYENATIEQLKASLDDTQ